MEWSNLNEQMIEEFFQDSHSPTNAEISLDFTRTSRQMGSNQKAHVSASPHHKQLSPEKGFNPETDILAYVDKEMQKFESWFRGVSNQKNKHANNIQAGLKAIQRQLMSCSDGDVSGRNIKCIQDSILAKVNQLSNKILKSQHRTCRECSIKQRKISDLNNQLSDLLSELQLKSEQLNKLNQIQIKELGYELSYEVENKFLHDKVDELTCRNSQLSQIVQAKTLELYKLNEEISKFHFQRSNFLSKTKTLQTRLHQMERSKSLLMSAAKNSTTHTEFSITNSNNTNPAMLKSQHQPNIDSTMIHTNQFMPDKPTADEYFQWFDKMKHYFLDKYKKDEREFLKKHPELKNDQTALKEKLNNFKKGHARYELAKSWNTIATYVNKNKQNFIELVVNQISPQIKIPIEGFHSNSKESCKNVEELEEQLKKSLKKAEGHLSQIQNLNQQLSNLKKTLLKEKQEKTKLSRELDELKYEFEEMQKELDHAQAHMRQCGQNPKYDSSCVELVHELEENLAQLERQLVQKTDQLNKAIYESKCQEQAHIKLSQSVRQYERLLYKQRAQKIKCFKESLPPQFLTTACRISPQPPHQHKQNAIVNEYEGRVYVGKQKISYKFDIVQGTDRKPNDQILVLSKKLIANCFYQSSSSAIISVGCEDSRFKEYFRGPHGMIKSYICEVYKLKLSQKRFLQIDVALSVIQMGADNMFDLVDPNPSKKISFRKQGEKIIVQNLSKFHPETEQQAFSKLNTAFNKCRQFNSHLVTVCQICVTDKKTKLQFTSKLYFAQIDLSLCLDQRNADQTLVKDVRALERHFNSLHFKQPLKPESNRLILLLSECLNINSKNLLIVNVSPSEHFYTNTVFSLSFGCNWKSLSLQKPQSLIRYREKTPQQSTSHLKHNSSHSMIQTPQLNEESFELKARSITKHRNSSSDHMITGGQTVEKKKRTISRLSIC